MTVMQTRHEDTRTGGNIRHGQDTRTDTQLPAEDWTNGTTKTDAPISANSTNGPPRHPLFPDSHVEITTDDLEGFVGAVTTTAQSQCEQCEDYADIESMVCQPSIDHFSFAAPDVSAPYSGPYPMTIQIQACLLRKINGWEDTALHDDCT